MNLYIELGPNGFIGNYAHFHLYEMYDNNRKGKSIIYDYDGNPHEFHYIDSSKDYLLPDYLKEKFMYSFLHGSHLIKVKNIPMSRMLRSHMEHILENNNFEYEWITPKDVELREKILALKLETKEDVIANKDLLFNNPIPESVGHKILQAFRLNKTKVHNGEIGLASFGDICKLMKIRDSIMDN